MNSPSNPPDLDMSRESRRRLTTLLFPDGVPRLWCPTLTHFVGPGRLDAARIQRHLEVLAPYAKGILVPGSTGEGWEMNDEEILALLEVVLDAARSLNLHVLVGVLKTDVPTMLQCLDRTVAHVRSRGGCSDPVEALSQSSVVGFTVCPPKGAALSQPELLEAMSSVLARGLPTALYQLPQVTENELAPETVAELAARFPNFYLFKDTSGRDQVAQAGLDLGGVFLVRGAEGGYAHWTKAGGGPYDGLLLSTANVFAPQLDAILDWLQDGQTAKAQDLAQRVETVVKETFAMVQDFATGNPFTNANKVLDHVMAFGARATDHPPPLLHSGVRLPAEWIARAVDLLRSQELLPARGYLE